MHYKPLIELLSLMDEPNRSKCIQLSIDHQDRFAKAPGSLTKHQAWEGGYVDHLEETMNLGLHLYAMMHEFRPLDFSISDVMLVLFLHDLEKPFRYVDPKHGFESEAEKQEFIHGLIEQYGIELTDMHDNALVHAHGEGEEYNRTERILKPLAAFVHMCDVASARIWFDYPKQL